MDDAARATGDAPPPPLPPTLPPPPPAVAADAAEGVANAAADADGFLPRLVRGSGGWRRRRREETMPSGATSKLLKVAVSIAHAGTGGGDGGDTPNTTQGQRQGPSAASTVSQLRGRRQQRAVNAAAAPRRPPATARGRCRTSTVCHRRRL